MGRPSRKSWGTGGTGGPSGPSDQERSSVIRGGQPSASDSGENIGIKYPREGGLSPSLQTSLVLLGWEGFTLRFAGLSVKGWVVTLFFRGFGL